jgi:hypothetical protein
MYSLMPTIATYIRDMAPSDLVECVDEFFDLSKNSPLSVFCRVVEEISFLAFLFE